MLQNLRIKNFALIEDLEMVGSTGLNVLTGETGAGKSILIDALNILLGEKAGPAFIRVDTDKAIIEGIFQTRKTVSNWLKLNELIDNIAGEPGVAGETNTAETNSELIITREITKTGSRFRINGILVNQSLVAELKPMLIHMHAQHEARTLLSSQSQLGILDNLADANHQKTLDKIQALYDEKTTLQKELDKMQISEEERLKKLDFARFQLEELQATNLEHTNEDEELAKKQLVLANVTQLDLASLNAYHALIGGNIDAQSQEDSTVNTGAIDSLQTAINNLERASKLDNNLNPISETLNNALALLEEAKSNLRHYRDTLETDPETMQDIESRIAQLATIKRKYGPDLAQAINQRDNLAQEIEQLENIQNETTKIESKLHSINTDLDKLALAISKNRKSLADKLIAKVKKELADLGMERCQFEIVFEKATNIGPNGFDRIEFMISPNPGQPLLPLSKIASGGELSRIMLALKSIVAGLDDPPTIVFDEIDAGLSGRIVQAVRDKLVRLSQVRQVLCITHQPIIAAAANNHLFIQKEHAEETTSVKIKVLAGQDRIKALAAMASGSENETIALDFAQSLINQHSQAK